MSLVVWAEQNFNPRSREGSDMNHPCHNRKHTISIHAPAKGATLHVTTYLIFFRNFKSTLPRRERRCSHPYFSFVA